MRAQIARWGNSLGLRVPKGLAQEIGLTEGSSVEIETKGNRLVVTPIRPKYTLDELLKDTTPEAFREYVVDWGSDVGREIVD
jgi:antitoxin MazE